MDINALREILLKYFKELRGFHFSVNNPLLWLFVFTVFLITRRFWEAKKSFSFSALLVLILLASTKAERLILENALLPGAASTTKFAVKLLTIFLVAVVFLYFAFIKEQ